jgi:Right handed beta helix region
MDYTPQGALRKSPVSADRFIAVGLFALFLVAFPSAAAAAGVVGDGTAASCTETTLDAALAGGGLITFNCGPAAHIIILSNQKTIRSGTTTIRGAGLITLSGGNVTRLFSVFPGATLVLEHLVLTNGFAPLTPQNGVGGAIRVEEGTLVLTRSTIRNSGTPLTGKQTGGAIENFDGKVTLTESLIENNESDHGGGIHAAGIVPRLVLVDTIVRNNRAQGENGTGGGLVVRGATTIEGGLIEGNTAVLGGGLSASEGILSITGTDIVLNTAAETGGGIHNSAGTLTLTNGTLRQNGLGLGNLPGGLALYNGPSGGATLEAVAVTEHFTSGLGGAVMSHGRLTVHNSVFSENLGVPALHVEGDGAIVDTSLTGNTVGIQVAGGTVTLTRSSLFENEGVGLLVGGAAEVTATNSTISRNGGSGVSMLGAATVHLRNATVAENGAGGAAQVTTSDTGRTTFLNTIVSGTGTMCSIAQGGKHISQGFNIASDSSCTFNAGGDRPNTDAQLGPLQNNGGPTRTHALLPGSPAIDRGSGIDCPTIDQRGARRPLGASCDVGAFEFGVLLAAVELNGSTFETGDIVTYHATVNPGLAQTPVDIYFGIRLPDGTLLSFVEEQPGVVGIVIGSTPVPFRANVTAVPLALPFEHEFGAFDQAGTYLAYAGLALAGSDPFLLANQVSLAVEPLLFTPSVPQ